MPSPAVLRRIARKGADLEKIAGQATRRPRLLGEIFGGMGADEARVKYGCQKVLRIVSEKNPKALYPLFDSFAGMLDCDNNFLRWGAILVLANLAAVDSRNRFRKLFRKFFEPIRGPVMVTAANVIGAGAKIARARPALAGRIAREILKVEKARYATAECRNVALGQAIRSLDEFYDLIRDREPVRRMVRRQLRNRRKSTRRKAEAFLRKRDPSPRK